MKRSARKSLFVAGGAIVAFSVPIILTVLVPLPAAATPQFATDTGKACAACHVSATGGGALTPYGEKFKANGNKAP